MKAQTHRSRKDKGKRLEIRFAKMLRDAGLDKDAKRMVLSGAAFGFETDIFTKLPFAFECKNHERIEFWKFWEQAEKGRKPFKDPVLVYSANHRPIMVIMTADDWISLVKKGIENEKR